MSHDSRDKRPPVSDETVEAYSIEYLRACADEEARRERLAELKRRIELDAYRPDADRIAEELLERGLLGD